MEGMARVEAFLDPFLEPSVNRTNSSTPEPPDGSTMARLETFRFHMLSHFPFIHLPAETTAQYLHDHRPFLLRAITCVASPAVCEKRVRAVELKHLLSDKVFCERGLNDTQRHQMGHTIDLLLGLLVYIAWGWDHQLSGRLMTMAMSLVREVFQNKPTASDMHTLGLLGPDMSHTNGVTPGEWLLECQRAVLACFVLSSVISTYSGQVDTLRWTPQMKYSLVAIGSNTDCHDDAILDLQVRLQLLTSQALQLRSQNRHTKYQAAAEALLSQLRDLHPAVLQHQGKIPSSTGPALTIALVLTTAFSTCRFPASPLPPRRTHHPRNATRNFRPTHPHNDRPLHDDNAPTPSNLLPSSSHNYNHSHPPTLHKPSPHLPPSPQQHDQTKPPLQHPPRRPIHHHHPAHPARPLLRRHCPPTMGAADGLLERAAQVGGRHALGRGVGADGG